MQGYKHLISNFLPIVILAGCEAPPRSTDSSQLESLNAPNTELASERRESRDFPDIAAGAKHACSIINKGRFKYWGVNQYSQLGGQNRVTTNSRGVFLERRPTGVGIQKCANIVKQ